MLISVVIFRDKVLTEKLGFSGTLEKFHEKNSFLETSNVETIQ